MAREMKDSGVAWIGEIPAEYSVHKLKRLIGERMQYGANESGVEFDDSLPRYIRITDITLDGKLKEEGKLSLQEKVAAPYLLHDGDILFARSGATVGKTFLYREAYGRAAFAGYLIRATIREGVSPEYIYYYTNSSLYDSWKNSVFVQATIQNIGADRYSEMLVVIPNTKEEQDRIVNFLNQKCSEIDAILEKTRVSIEEYKKLKQAIITQAVTKGIRNNRRMQGSRIEWAGRIPEGIKLSRVGLHYDIILGKMLCATQANSTYTLEPYYCAADVHFDGVSNSERKTMWFSPSEKELYLVKKGDLLVVEGGAGAGGCSIVDDATTPTYIQNSIMIVRAKKDGDCRYLRYWLESLVKRGYIDVVCNKATIPHFTKDKLACVPYFVFSAEEKSEIADYLDIQCSRIDALIQKKEQHLLEIERYKKSLIYEYVTGKKEVPQA